MTFAHVALWIASHLLPHVHTGETTTFSAREGHVPEKFACASDRAHRGQSRLSALLESEGYVFASREGRCWSVRLLINPRTWRWALAADGDYGPGKPSRLLDLWDSGHPKKSLPALLQHNGKEPLLSIRVVP